MDRAFIKYGCTKRRINNVFIKTIKARVIASNKAVKRRQICTHTTTRKRLFIITYIYLYIYLQLFFLCSFGHNITENEQFLILEYEINHLIDGV